MTNEEKQLLLKDLCARLPYEVKVKNVKNNFDINTFNHNVEEIKILIEEYDIKPYLRPMSSMTEEEIEFMDDKGFRVYKKANDFNNTCDVSDDGWDNNYIDKQSFEDVIDLFCSHHLDYRGLIEKGLALEAPKDMYKTE